MGNYRKDFISKSIILTIFLLNVYAIGRSQQIEKIQHGDFEQWISRDIEESFIIGGKTKRIYGIGKTATVAGNKVLPKNTSIWGTSNAYAKVVGVTKTSLSVSPENGPTGKCARLETCFAECKAIGLVDIKILAAGCLFWGNTIEPISNPSNPFSNINWGIPFKKRPTALILDYKSLVSTEGIITKCTMTSKSTTKGNDPEEVYFILQYRWEDSEGNIFAKRVGTAAIQIHKTTDGWVKNKEIPIIYGDASKNSLYKSYMSLRSNTHYRGFYAINSKGKNVPINEVGWAAPNTTPTHAILTITTSSQGAYSGALGNKMWVDNVRLKY